MDQNKPLRLQLPRVFQQFTGCVALGLGTLLSLGLTGCKNASGSGSPAPLSFPFGAPGPSASGAGATAAAGTVSMERDPLLGLTTAASPTKSGLGYSSGAVPPVPSPTGATSPAALTSGNNPTLDNGLRMPNGTPAPASGQPGPASAPPIRLDQQPGSSGFAPAAPAVGGLVPTSLQTNADEYRQLQGEMTRRQVVYQRLEMLNEGNWRFLASIPDPANPANRRNFDVRASTDVGAMRTALQEMDRAASPVAPAPLATAAVPATFTAPIAPGGAYPIAPNRGTPAPATYTAAPLATSGAYPVTPGR